MKNKIGTYLRQHREEKHLTLQQAAEQTGIREPYLAALEEGDFHKIPGDVFIRGFLRNYGNYLGLDGNGLVEAYRTGSEPEKILKAVEELAPVPATPSGDTLIPRKPATQPEKKATPEAKAAPAPESGKQAEPFDKVTALKQMEPVGYGVSRRNGREGAPKTEKEAPAGKPDLDATRIMPPLKAAPPVQKGDRAGQPQPEKLGQNKIRKNGETASAGNPLTGKAAPSKTEKKGRTAAPTGKESQNPKAPSPAHETPKEVLETVEHALDRENMEEALDAGKAKMGGWLDRIRDFIDENLYETVPEDEADEEFGATSAGDSKAPAFSFKVFTTVFVVCLAIFTIVMAYFVFGGKTTPELKATNTITDGVKSDHSSEKSEENKKATEAVAPKKEEEPKGDEKTLGKGSGLTVVVTYKKPVWTQTTIDGKQVEAATVAKGSTRTYKGNQSVSINFGSIRDVVITVNGKEVPYGSKEWGVVTRTFKAK